MKVELKEKVEKLDELKKKELEILEEEEKQC